MLNVFYSTSLKNYPSFSLQVPSILSILLGPLFRLGLRNDEILYLRAVIQRTIDASPAVIEYGLEKKIAA